MKHLTPIFVLALLLNSFCLIGQYEVVFDTSFGTNGIVTIPSYKLAAKKGVFQQSDGKLILMTRNPNHYFTLLRINTDGSLDGSYKNGWVNSTPVAMQEEYVGTMLPNNDIIVAGFSNIIPGHPKSVVVYKYLEDGTLDNTFGNAGKTVLAESSEYYLSVLDLISDSDSSVLVLYGGYTDSGIRRHLVCRLGLNGIMDSSFADNGKYLMPTPAISRAAKIHQSSDGSFYVFDNLISTQSAVYKFTPDWNFVPGYKISGSNFNMVLHGILGTDEDGKLLLWGNLSYKRFRIVRLMPDGSLDHSFSKDGMLDVALHDFSAGVPQEIVEGKDGKLLMPIYGGATAMRLNPNGTLDYSFDLDGVAYVIPANSIANYGFIGSSGMLVQPDKKLVFMTENSAKQVRVVRAISAH